MAYGINNVFLAIFSLSVLIKYSSSTFRLQKWLLPAVALFLLMLLSYFWSIDKDATLKAIQKEISLLLIPILFMVMKPFSKEQGQKIIKYYSYAMVLYVTFYLLKAMVRFILTNDTNVFFYHELVTKEVNAIHVSVYVAVAFFYFFTKEVKTKLEIFCSLLLFGFILLLSSKNIVLVFSLLILIDYFFILKSPTRCD